MKCVFCESPAIKERMPIAQNSLARAFPTNIPVVPGHTLIIPTRCVAFFEELTQSEINAIFELGKEIRAALVKVFGATGFNYAWNEGKTGGQSVPHFHLHVLPRKEGDSGITEYDPRKFLYRPGSRAETPEAELQEIAKIIRNAMN